jgi:tetratricopeptide (TPR) repeat protein
MLQVAGGGWEPMRGRDLRQSAVCLVACSLLVLVASARALAQQDVDLYGRVRTDEGVVVKSGATARLETEEHELVSEQPVNTGGEFYFLHVAKREYLLTVTAEGFDTYQQQIDLGEVAGTYIVNVNLTPAHKTPRAPSPPPALSDTQAPKEARREYEKATKALATHKIGEAQEHLAKAVELYPCYARAQTDLGLIFSQQKDYAKSEAALKKSLSCDPGFVDAYVELGQLLNAETRFGEALPVLEQGARLSPGSWQFYFQSGAAHYGLKQYTAAESDYLKVQSLSSNPPPELHVKLADVYLRENAYDKAYANMQEYLKAEPQGRFAPRIRQIMKQMQARGVVAPQAER